MDWDLVAASIARQQHSLLTIEQARAAGIPEHHMKLRIRQGRWERVHRGVYRIAGAASNPHQTLMAASLATGGVVSHRSAAELWAFDGTERGWAEVTVETSHRPRIESVRVHRTKDLNPQTSRFGIPLTNPMRTIVDLGLAVPRWTVQRAMDDALGRKLVSVEGLVQIWRDVARPGRNGSGVLRSLLEERLPFPSATRLEKAMLRLHRDHGLPEPLCEHDVFDDRGRFVGRVDFVHLEPRVVIEVDGYATHSSPEAFVTDRQRDRKLRALGWTVLRFTWLEVMYAPREVADEIRPFLATSAVS
ncbi:MAG: DUF559 domain-containing protein [Actinobacteria bacterium]|nr:DUF559 domain-containing protein [Actinomycetota bacterium]